MQNTLHATFANAEDGIRAVEALLYHGVRAEDISLILPQKQHAPSIPQVSLRNGNCETVLDAEQGLGLGLSLGLLTALCIPGMGMIAGSEALLADLMAWGALVGGVAGGFYGFLIDRGVADGIARVMSHHLEGGGTTLSVAVSDRCEKAEIVRIFDEFSGQLIKPS